MSKAKKKSTLNPKAKNFFPNERERESNELAREFTRIFSEVCKFRKDEHELAKKAKKAKSIMEKKQKKTGKSTEIIDFEAFQDLRNYKNTIYSRKNELYDRLEFLSDFLRESHITPLELTESKVFKEFVKNNKTCQKLMKWNYENEGTFEGLEKYLLAAYNREAIKKTRNKLTSSALKTKSGAIRKLKKLSGGKGKTKETKNTKRRLYTGPRGGQYYLNNGRKVYT